MCGPADNAAGDAPAQAQSMDLADDGVAGHAAQGLGDLRGAEAVAPKGCQGLNAQGRPGGVGHWEILQTRSDRAHPSPPFLRLWSGRLHQPQGPQARDLIACDDEVIVDRKAKRACRLDDLFGHRHVGAGGGRVAGRMVVHEQNGAG